jgi:hypothetical protein
MAFESVQIKSQRNADPFVDGYREDLVIADVMTIALTNDTGVTSYRWELLGRPETSVAGGAGPEPVLLGTGLTATFTVDGDAGWATDGTYIVGCTLNVGAPTETRITVALVRLNSAVLTINAITKTLRFPSAFEVNQDTADALINQGWAKMLTRLLRKALAGGGAAAPRMIWLSGVEKLADAIVSSNGPAGFVLKAWWYVDFDLLTSTNILANLSLIASTTAGGGDIPTNAVLQIMVGSSSPSAQDGTAVVQVTRGSGQAEAGVGAASAPYARPTGRKLVQVRMDGGVDQISDGGGNSFSMTAYGLSLAFVEA